jgi:hypothetical protein
VQSHSNPKPAPMGVGRFPCEADPELGFKEMQA